MRPRGLATSTRSPVAMLRSSASREFMVTVGSGLCFTRSGTLWNCERKSVVTRDPELNTRGNCSVRSGCASGPSFRLSVHRERVVAVFLEDGRERSQISLSGYRSPARPSNRSRPFSHLRYSIITVGTPRQAARGPHLFEGKPGGLQTRA